jgi:putative endonuclease
MNCHVYIMASRRNGTLYVGVTSDLIKRVWQHRNHVVPGFSSRYGVGLLVWFESTPDIEAAIAREKQLKNWKREWKLALIEKSNPCWRDLYEDILGKPLDAGSSPA